MSNIVFHTKKAVRAFIMQQIAGKGGKKNPKTDIIGRKAKYPSAVKVLLKLSGIFFL